VVFLNLSRDLLGIGPEDGETFQVSSYKERRGRRLPGLAGEFQKKCVDLSPGGSAEAELDGPGLITRIWVALPLIINHGALRDLVLEARFDGEDDPSVLTPLGDLFGATFARPREYSSAYTAITSGAYLCFFPMPFRRSARITVTNQGRRTARLFFYQVTYLKLHSDLAPGMPYFHCRWHRERCPRGGDPFTVLAAEGSGYYLGCHLDMQGGGWPWRLNPVHIQMPEGFGLGMLEGWERIWIDGSEEPNVQGTGGEDYFNSAWYFTRSPSTWLTHGVTRRRYDTRRVSCYRFHVEMPVAFRNSIEVTIDHGLDNLLPATYDGTAYWYQKEPHGPFDELPRPRERRPLSTVPNRIIMGSPVIAGALIAAAARRARKTALAGGRSRAGGTKDLGSGL
jgi:hypothetical protein